MTAVTSNFTKLFEIADAGQSQGLITKDALATSTPVSVHDILHLAELVPIVRERLSIDPMFPDDGILAGLRAISSKSHPRARWKAAFGSNLGHWLALRSNDLHASLNTLISLLPPPRS